MTGIAPYSETEREHTYEILGALQHQSLSEVKLVEGIDTIRIRNNNTQITEI